MKRNLIVSLMMMTGLFAQSVVGVVTDANSNPLAGANVVVEGTDNGGVTDVDGKYTIDVGASGDYDLTASFIGYSTVTNTVTVDDIVGTVNFLLEIDAVSMSALEVLASRADENTPVAYTTVGKEEMEMRLGSQDIPMSLNMTPSVYATQQGGGAGDARINVRGFNQRNVAVMINGVPQNDMENGWVYWSNWDGVADAAHSIQMQRGLSAVNLATPSIGGTMNILTDPASHDKGGKFKQEAGEGGFLKTTLNYNSGLIDDKLAISGTIVRKTGDGIVDGTWTDAWAYT
jgi:outer membrane cobalamin receptor